MRRILTTALVVGLMCGTAAAGGISVFGSGWQLTDDDSVAGFGGRLSLGNKLAFDIAATWYDSVDLPQYELPGDPSHVIGDLQVLPIDVGVRYTFSTGIIVRPFVGAGLSIFLANAEGAHPDIDPGYYLLGGIYVGRESGLNLVLDLLWREANGQLKIRSVDGVDTSYTYNLDLGGFGANLGVAITF